MPSDPPEETDNTSADAYPDGLTATIPYTVNVPDMRESVDVPAQYRRRDVLQELRAGLGAITVAPGLTGCTDTEDYSETEDSDVETPYEDADDDVLDDDRGYASGVFDTASFSDEYPAVFKAEAEAAYAAAHEEMVTYNRYLRNSEGYDRPIVGPDSLFLQFAYDQRAEAIAPRYAGRAGVTALDGFKDLTEYHENGDLFREDLLPVFVGLMYPTVRHLREYEIMRKKSNQEAITQIDYLVQGGVNGVATVDLTRQSFAKAANILERSNTVSETRQRLYDMAQERVEIRGQ